MEITEAHHVEVSPALATIDPTGALADVAGMRALRGGRPRKLMIAGASDPVRRRVGLLGRDTDPGVTVAA